MLTSFVVGIAAGFILAIPPGPIAIAVIKQALEGNERYGLKLGLGASAMDVVFSFIAAFATSTVVVAIRNAITSNGWYLLSLQIIAVVVLVLLAIKYLKPDQISMGKAAEKEEAQEHRVQQMGLNSPYVVGIAIALTNLASPTFLPSLMVVVASLQQSGWVEHSFSAQVLYALGFGIGAAGWFIVMLRLLGRLRAKLSSSFLSTIFKFAAGSFILFACILLYNVISATDWRHLPGL